MVLMEAQGIILYLYVSLGSGVSKHVYNHAWARIGIQNVLPEFPPIQTLTWMIMLVQSLSKMLHSHL